MKMNQIIHDSEISAVEIISGRELLKHVQNFKMKMKLNSSIDNLNILGSLINENK